MDVALAQVNIAALTAPIDSPDLRDFVEALDRINALAESASGFVWRLMGDGNDATSLRPFPNPNIIVNMSVWQDRAALEHFTYRTDHSAILHRRREWFEPSTAPAVAMWHIEDGHRPTLGEARARLDFLHQRGPTPYAFGFRGEHQVLVTRRTALDDAEARRLIAELNADLERRDSRRNYFALDPDEVEADSGGFFVNWLAGHPVGCGAVRRIDPQTAEIKRMYTRPRFGGAGLGAAMLSHLTGVARDLGVRRLVLETSEHCAEAIAIYRRAGFEQCPCWGEYLESPSPRCAWGWICRPRARSCGAPVKRSGLSAALCGCGGRRDPRDRPALAVLRSLRRGRRHPPAPRPGGQVRAGSRRRSGGGRHGLRLASLGHAGIDGQPRWLPVSRRSDLDPDPDPLAPPAGGVPGGDRVERHRSAS